MLADYGAEFPAFLSSFEAFKELEYLSAVAVLDRLWTEAHVAADAAVLTAADLGSLTPDALVRSRLVPHPAARWRSFDSMPIYTLWRRHRENLPLDDALDWRGESALLTRPAGSVRWSEIAQPAVMFLNACAASSTFSEAIELNVGANADASAWLPQLIQAGAFSGVQDGACRS